MESNLSPEPTRAQADPQSVPGNLVAPRMLPPDLSPRTLLFRVLRQGVMFFRICVRFLGSLWWFLAPGRSESCRRFPDLQQSVLIFSEGAVWTRNGGQGGGRFPDPMRLAAGGRRQWSAAVGKSGCRRLSTSEGGQAGGKQSAGTSQYSTDTQPGGGMKILGRMA